MSQFGHWGRAGNQLFQYTFLTGYAKREGAELQLPQWVGTYLFGASEPPISQRLKPWIEIGGGLQHHVPPKGDELVNHDFRGYAQYHTSYYVKDKARIRRLFKPVRAIANRVEPAAEQLIDSGKTVVGIHLRRGDYGQRIFPIIPTSWYLKRLRKNWSNLIDPVLFIATESTELVNEFQEFCPSTTETLGISLREQLQQPGDLKRDALTHNLSAMDWYPDFYLLSQCDVILGPSSTFSFFAAMLNPSLKEYHRASLKTESFELTDPWDSYPMMREHVRDYPHLEGITVPSNPYW